MRIGLVAKKIGMSRYFKPDGTNIPVTLLKVDECKVIEHKSIDRNGYLAVKLSFGSSKKSKVNKPTKGYFKKIKSESTNLTKEFRVSENGFVDLGHKINVNHFINGQLVDISGLTIGKGFAGGMKRHNFGGNRASHGVSISHRSHGSTGQCQDPGKVFKGKKMAGRLGNVKRTMQNLEVIMTNEEKGLIFVKGSIPGPKGLFVSIRDSAKFSNKNLPYPTHLNEKSSVENKKEQTYLSSVNAEKNSSEIKNNDIMSEEKIITETKISDKDSGNDQTPKDVSKNES